MAAPEKTPDQPKGMNPPAPRSSSEGAGPVRLERRERRCVRCMHQPDSATLLFFTHFRLELPAACRISSGFKLQFLRFPFTKPEMMTNTSTTTLMLVKTLFTQADSFTPKASRPAQSEGKTNRPNIFWACPEISLD